MNLWFWLFCVSIILVGVLVYYLVRFGMVILKVQDAIEESLDKLDTHYQSISKVLDIPLFYDSPQIKQVVRDIDSCRNAILYVANQLVLNNREYIDGEEENNKAS